MGVSDYSTTPGLNGSINGINIAEGCAPGNINDAIRQQMADTRAFWDVAVRTSGNFTVAGTITFTLPPVFTDAGGTRTALGLGTAAVEDVGAFQAALDNLTAARVLGRGAADGAGAVEELTLGTGLTMAATALQSVTLDTATWEAGTSTTEAAVSPAKVRAAVGASGAAPVFAARAWVTFDGSTTPPTILASGNIASVARPSNGRFDISFTTALPDANYAVQITCGSGANSFIVVGAAHTRASVGAVTPTASGFTIFTGASGSNLANNPEFVSVVVFR